MQFQTTILKIHNEGVVMIFREAAPILKRLLKSFPIVTVTGPRQSGKSTLVKEVFPEKQYVSFENLTLRKLAKEDPNGFLSQFPNGAIIDEVQRVPDIFSYLQTLVDERNEVGLFILTGSNQFEYMQNLTQSLAGRTAIFKLLPFSYSEIYGKNKVNLDEMLLRGFYPAIFDKNISETDFYPSYIATYLERDVRQISNIMNLSVFQNFLELCAGRTGQILNKNSIAKKCGVSQPTIEEWITILEASFIVYRMRPYHKNLKKRIIKSPKLYFFDTGLVCNLLNIETTEQLKKHPLRGEIFETYAVSEFIKYRLHQGFRINLYYYRDSNMNEIDVIIDTGYGPVPVEIKSGKTINDSFFKGLNYFRKLSGKHKKSGLIYGGDRTYLFKNTKIKNYAEVYEMYDELVKSENWILEN